jgi:NADH-quinone oxidoreductase subunit H
MTLAAAFDAAVRVALVLVAYLSLPLLVGQMEHKAMAHAQGRLGPMYAGAFHGWAQLVADGVKFAQKERVIPAAADQRVFALAPGVAFLPYLLVVLVIPVAPGVAALDLRAGLLFALAVAGVGVLGTLMAGWASANKFALLGGLRSASALMAYELPLVLAAVGPAIAAGTLSLVGIVDAWQWWWVPWQALGLFVFVVAGTAELTRPPFDMPVAESELVFGPYTEYGGLRFAFFLLAEYAGIVVLSALTAVLFLGGWHGPAPEALGWLWTLTKTFAVAFVVVWVRVSWPRMRADQLQRFAWTVLVPLALLQVAITATVVVLR